MALVWLVPIVVFAVGAGLLVVLLRHASAATADLALHLSHRAELRPATVPVEPRDGVSREAPGGGRHQ